MKKILTIGILIFILTSCFWWERQNEKYIVKEEVKKEKVILEEENEKTEKSMKEIKSQQEDFLKYDKSFNKTTSDFIDELNKNPDILLYVKCEELVSNETKDYCAKEKKKYLEVMWTWTIEKNEKKVDLEEKNKEISKLINDLNSNPDFFKYLNCEEFKEEKTKKFCTKEKKDYLEMIKKFDNSWNKQGEELNLLIERYNKDSSVIKDIKCDEFKFEQTKKLCKEMKEDYIRFIDYTVNESFE